MDSYYLLPRTYQHLLNKSVLITGTESCGKTTLARKLALEFVISTVRNTGTNTAASSAKNTAPVSRISAFIPNFSTGRRCSR